MACAAAKEVGVPEGAPGGMHAFRNSLVASFLFKAYVAAALQLCAKLPHGLQRSAMEWATDDASAVHEFERPPARGVQFYAEADPSEIVGQPVKHRAADLQVLSLMCLPIPLCVHSHQNLLLQHLLSVPHEMSCCR